MLGFAGAGAVVEGHEDGDGGVVAGAVVEVGEAPAGGGLVREAGHGGGAGDGLGRWGPQGAIGGVAADVAKPETET